MENNTYPMTQDGHNFQVSKSVHLFVEFLKEMGEDVSNIDDVINAMQPFLTCWHDYKKSIFDSQFDNPNLKKFALFHTIKTGTQYAHQQKKVDGKPVVYPISGISNGEVHSTAVGGDYPIKDCNFFTKVGGKIVPLK